MSVFIHSLSSRVLSIKGKRGSDTCAIHTCICLCFGAYVVCHVRLHEHAHVIVLVTDGCLIEKVCFWTQSAILVRTSLEARLVFVY